MIGGTRDSIRNCLDQFRGIGRGSFESLIPWNWPRLSEWRDLGSEQQMLRRACESIKSRQSLNCSQTQSMDVDENKKEGKDQESLQSSTTPEELYQFSQQAHNLKRTLYHRRCDVIDVDTSGCLTPCCWVETKCKTSSHAGYVSMDV